MPEIGNKIQITADIDMIDETFDVSQSENYHLSIQIEQFNVTFCVLNTVIKKYIVLRSYVIPKIDVLSVFDAISFVNECKSFFDNDEMLRLKYKSSSALWVSPRCTLVPENLFDNDETDAFMTFNNGVVDDEHIMQNHIKAAKLYNVFSYPKSLTAFMKEYQPNIRFFHHATPFIKSIISDTASSGKVIMAVYYYSDNMDVITVQNGKLLFYNTFQTSTVNDMVYYITLVSNVLKIDMPSTKLMLLGNDKQKTELFENYMNRVVVCEPLSVVTYSHYISESFRKNFINLFNLHGCE